MTRLNLVIITYILLEELRFRRLRLKRRLKYYKINFSNRFINIFLIIKIK